MTEEDLVFELGRLLKFQAEMDRHSELMVRFGLSPGEARIALALYAREGGLTYDILAKVGSNHEKECLNPQGTCATQVSRISRRLGLRATITIREFGYRLSPAGRALIRKTLEESSCPGLT